MTTKNWKKITAEKKIKFFLDQKLSLGLHKERSSYRRSLQLSKEAIQHFKTWTSKFFFYFCGSFLPSWIRILIPDPDPLTRLNPDPIRIRIRNPAEFSPKSAHSGGVTSSPHVAEVPEDTNRPPKVANRLPREVTWPVGCGVRGCHFPAYSLINGYNKKPFSQIRGGKPSST